jgi:FKBP-type peptidyl-prolyl cis-trans isomerase SlyD
MSQTVAAGKVVHMHYTLTSPEGEVLDSSEGREPLAYLHGASNIVPGLERQLTGLAVGDHVDAVVPPEEGYGERNPDATHVLPKSAFPEDFPIAVGTPLALQAEGGQVLHCFIIAVRDDAVMVDANHPLAGVTLSFSVDIVEIRDATAEEMTHGHPHGPGGHHH